MKTKLIINELKFIEDILETKEVPDDMSPNMLIMYLSRYYYSQFPSLSELTYQVCETMKMFDFDVSIYQEYKAADRIRRIHNDISKGKIKPLRNIDYIPIYKSEYEKVMSCSTDKEKKFLFTMYALARYTDIYGWVYLPESQLYKYANICKKKDDDMIYKLIAKKLIKTPHKVDDIKIGVDLSEGNEEEVFKLYDLDNIGNQLMVKLKNNYIMCELCGKIVVIKSKSDHRTKYCSKCKVKMQSVWDKKKYEKIKKLRENE